MMNLFAVLLWSLFISVELKLDGSIDVSGVEHGSQVRSRRSAIFKTPTSRCYLAFFVNSKPPIGFRRNGKNVRYICQSPPGNSFFVYATMFDLNYKIPIYSAYYVTAAQARQFGAADRKGETFHQEKGQDIPLDKQGSAKMYRGVLNIHKGHLLPAETFSFSKYHIRSTFTYTNAVPQYAAFNTGQWLKYEKLIRQFATKKCSVQGGTLYLITGISEVRIPRQHPVVILTSGLPKQKRIINAPKIVIPNSMWTAGCCVRPNGGVVGSFALIGNNVQNTNQIHMSQVKVPLLQRFLHVGVSGFGGRSISLFPGNPSCSSPKNNVHL